MSMTHLVKEETAAQALAVIKSRFQKPEPDEVLDILERAKRQAQASRDDGEPKP